MIDRVTLPIGSLPRLGLGCMRLPTAPDGAIDEEKGLALVDAAMERGLNYFDTAYLYHGGLSEPFLKKALSRYSRDSYLLADKLPLWECAAPEDMDRIFEEQKQRCGVEWFDYYFIHSLDRNNWEKAQRFGVQEWIRRHKAAGDFRHIGFSFHDTPQVLGEILDGFDGWEYVQLQLNYLDWELQDAKTTYKMVTERGLTVFVMEPIRGKFLAELPPSVKPVFEGYEGTPASFALRFVGSLPGVGVILSGMNRMDQLLENIGTFTDFRPLSETERMLAQRACAAFRELHAIPCTGCRYCVEHCPQGIDIPGCFASYNDNKLMDNGFGQNVRIEYFFGIPEGHRADSCIGCGACKEHCPQHIDIPSLMPQVHAALLKTQD